MTTLLLGTVACDADGTDDDRVDHPVASARCPIVTRGGGCRAAAPKEVVSIASGGFLLPAAGFASDTDGAFVAFSVRWGDARIVSARAARGWSFGDADTLPWTQADGATGARVHGHNALYFVASTGTTPALHVAMLENGALGRPAPVALDGSDELPSWPQAAGLADGRALLAFVTPQRRVLLGVDDGTGTRFGVTSVPLTEPDMRGVLAHVGTTRRGSWVLTYQVADASWRFRSHVIVSRDEGRSWSDARAGKLSEGDVSGAFPIARNDEGADVYYAKQTARSKTACRRALHEDGTLGPEQSVTSTEIGDVASPQPRRLPDGRIALMLSLEHSETRKDLALVVLDGDAP